MIGTTQILPKNIKKIYDINIKFQQVLLLSNENQIQLLDLKNNKSRIIQHFSKIPVIAKISPDANYILVNLGEKEGHLLKLENNSEQVLKEGHAYDILCLGFSENNQMIATGGQGQQLVLWNLKGQKLKNWEVGDMPVLSLAFSPKENILATGDMEYNAKIWDTSGNLKNTFSHEDEVILLEFARDGTSLMTISRDQKLNIWTKEGSKKKEVDLDFLPNNLYITDKERILLTDKKGKSILLDKEGVPVLKSDEAKIFETLNFFVFENKKTTPTKKVVKEKDIQPPTKNYTEFFTVNDTTYQFEMIWVEGGNFAMGSEEFKDTKPVHQVNLDDFYMAKYEITQDLWKAVMGSNPSKYKGCVQCPVENISWKDAMQFVERLNKITGKKYSLPTEAQWEYAARGGKQGKNYKYAGSDDLEEVAWYDQNATFPQPVGIKKNNELGIYDMSGNVGEWCLDTYSTKTYKKTPNNFLNPLYYLGNIVDNKNITVYKDKQKSSCSLRGGSWFNNLSNCNITHRLPKNINDKYDYFGLRLCQTP